MKAHASYVPRTMQHSEYVLPAALLGTWLDKSKKGEVRAYSRAPFLSSGYANGTCRRDSGLCGNTGTHAYRSTLRGSDAGNILDRCVPWSGALAVAIVVAEMVR